MYWVLRRDISSFSSWAGNNNNFFCEIIRLTRGSYVTFSNHNDDEQRQGKRINESRRTLTASRYEHEETAPMFASHVGVIIGIDPQLLGSNVHGSWRDEFRVYTRDIKPQWKLKLIQDFWNCVALLTLLCCLIWGIFNGNNPESGFTQGPSLLKLLETKFIID